MPGDDALDQGQPYPKKKRGQSSLSKLVDAGQVRSRLPSISRQLRIAERQRRASYQPARRAGHSDGDAKALKARSIGFAIEAWVNGLLAACGTSILRSTISEIGPRRWRLGLLLGLLPMCRAFGPRHSATRERVRALSSAERARGKSSVEHAKCNLSQGLLSNDRLIVSKSV